VIVFHEGLPGSGKSYEACLYHILPALKAGRVVVTNIEGINIEKFAEVSGIAVAYLKHTLITVFDPDLDIQKEAFLAAPNDCLLVIDEIQNIFPSERQKLTPEWSKFITEHRHQGIDIILMGQDRRDCHALWRRRIQRVVLFLKLDAVGSSGRYRWQLFEATKPEKYKLVSQGIKKYESKYFGLYSSYQEGAEHRTSYTDKRGNVFKTSAFTFWLPLFVVVLFFAARQVHAFFTSPEPSKPHAVQPIKTASASVLPLASQPVAANAPPVIEKYIPVDVFDEAAHGRRLRLSGLVYNQKKLLAFVEALDGGRHLYDTFTVQEIQALGWIVLHEEYGLLITKGDLSYVARPFDIDDSGRVNRRTREDL